MGFFQDLSGKTANKGLQQSANEAQGAYKVALSNYRPYVNTGFDAQATLASTLGLNGQQAADQAFSQYQKSPGYDFQMGQGTEAIDRSAASRGSLASGGTLKALQEFGQGLAAQDYGNWQQNLGGIAGTGLNATTNLVNSKLNTAGTVGNAYAQMGANKTAGAGAMLSALGSALAPRPQ